MAKAYYDKETDVLRVYLGDEPGPIVRTDEVAPGVVVSYGPEGRLGDVTVYGVTKLPPFRPGQVY